MIEAEKEIKRMEVAVFTKWIIEHKSKLFNAIDKEKYEEAVELRDMIKIKQGKLKCILVSI